MTDHAYLNESAFVRNYHPLGPDGSDASSIREAISRVNDLSTLREQVTDERVVWTIIDTSQAFVAEQGQSNAALGYFLAKPQHSAQAIRVVLDHSSFCVLWHEIDSTQQAYLTSAYNADDARKRFLEDTHMLVGEDAEINVDFFLEKTFVLSLTAEGPFEIHRADRD